MRGKIIRFFVVFTRLVVLNVLLFFMTYSGTVSAGILGSPHDFSDELWSEGKVCLPCHTPHNAETIQAPLWNHELSQATYSIYTSNSLIATPGQPGIYSMLCLSCHDGTVAVDSFGGNNGSNKIPPDSSAHLGIDLSDDHPVGIEWLHKDADKLTCSKCHLSHGGGVGGGTGDVPFFDGKVECASCHDVHNKENLDNLLRVSNVGSGLCLYCHPK